MIFVFFFFKQKTAYEMRISDWSSDVCSSDLVALTVLAGFLLFLAMGYDPGRALYHFFIAPLTSLYGWSELMVKGAPLILIGVGLAIGFRANAIGRASCRERVCQ